MKHTVLLPDDRSLALALAGASADFGQQLIVSLALVPIKPGPAQQLMDEIMAACEDFTVLAATAQIRLSMKEAPVHAS